MAQSRMELTSITDKYNVTWPVLVACREYYSNMVDHFKKLQKVFTMEKSDNVFSFLSAGQCLGRIEILPNKLLFWQAGTK